MNSFQEGNYYALRINRYIAESRYFEGLALAEQYLESSIEVQNKPWIETALLYIKFNEYDSARQCLEEYKNSNPSASENIKFNLACSELYHQTKEYEKMMSYYEHYLNLYNGMMVGSLKQGTGFSEMEVGLISRIRTEQTKNQLFILLVLLLALLTIALVLFFIHKIRFAKFEQKEIEARNKQLLSIYQAMKEESKKHDPLSGNVQSDNIELLDKICIIGLTGNGRMFRDSEELLKSVRKDKEELFKTINLMFSLHHSEFIEYLRERGLSEREIACSCLYVLGLQGKELDIYGSPRTTYRINGEIRKKLGLTSHDAPLPQYLSELLKQVES